MVHWHDALGLPKAMSMMHGWEGKTKAGRAFAVFFCNYWVVLCKSYLWVSPELERVMVWDSKGLFIKRQSKTLLTVHLPALHPP